MGRGAVLWGWASCRGAALFWRRASKQEGGRRTRGREKTARTGREKQTSLAQERCGGICELHHLIAKTAAWTLAGAHGLDAHHPHAAQPLGRPAAAVGPPAATSSCLQQLQHRGARWCGRSSAHFLPRLRRQCPATARVCGPLREPPLPAHTGLLCRGIASKLAAGAVDIPALVDGVLRGERLAVSRGITLCESSNPAHQLQVCVEDGKARLLLRSCWADQAPQRLGKNSLDSQPGRTLPRPPHRPASCCWSSSGAWTAPMGCHHTAAVMRKGQQAYQARAPACWAARTGATPSASACLARPAPASRR